ncbi:MAG: DNA translocase FtsK, partial [Planctomycetota bacterium]
DEEDETGVCAQEDELEDEPDSPTADAGDAEAVKITDITKRRKPPTPASYRERVGDYELPPVSLLDDPDPIDKEAIEILCREKAYVLEQTLNEVRLEVKVASIETGPVITVFELKLAPGIKVSQIASLTNDMARALKAPAVRVVAPLPGRNTIGIEVPNLDKEKVRIKDLMRRASKRTEAYQIPLYLGKDASGQPLISDLTRMPHLLIAGTTGSGKSVCVSSIIMSILLTRTPEEVQLILIDPKVVELSIFKDIPHLMCPIVTEMNRAEGILDWAATKMDERYALLAEAGVKDIVSYNRLGEAGLRERMGIDDDDEMERIPVHMPYIVIVVDELADLMMTSAKEVEFYLCRLAQKSRAVGIHLIVSTQRPQANVVTGLIKSNLPSRIAFRVSSRLDSRIVLDQNGGEVLMGQGDMLFLPPGQSKLVRAQGTFVGDDELRGVVRHVKSQGAPSYDPQLMRAPKTSDGGGERDELFDQAVDIIIASGRGSVSLLQRKLTIGYGRASRLIDQMYDAGIVGDYKGSQAREVLMTADEWAKIREARDRAEIGDLFTQ